MDRPLDGLEQTFLLASQEVRVNVLGFARVRGDLKPEHLRKALDLAQQKHPLTRVRLVDWPHAPRFVSGTPPIPLRVVPRTDDQQWLREADVELHESFPFAEGPMLRCKLLYSPGVSDLIITFNHTIGDGLSCVNLVRDLLHFAAEVAAGRTPQVTSLPELPPIRDLNPHKATGPASKRLLREEVWRILKIMFLVRPKRLRIDTYVHPRQRRTTLIHLGLSEAETTALAARCKQEGTTVLGALGAALLLAAAEDVGRRGVIGMAVPVSLRGMLPPAAAEAIKDAFGYYSWGVGVYFRPAPGDDFWDLARQVRQEAAKELERDGALKSLALVEFKAPRVMRQGALKLIEQLDRDYPVAVAASNVGRLEAPERFGDLVWETSHFCASADTGGANFGVAATTFRGKMMMNFVHPEALLSQPRGERLAERTMHYLRGAARTRIAEPATREGPTAQAVH